MIENIITNLVAKCIAPETTPEDFIVNMTLLGQLIAMAKYGDWTDTRQPCFKEATPSIRTGRKYGHLTVCK